MPTQPTAHYAATILRAAPGKRLAKRYRDASKRPDDYDAGVLFTVEEIEAPTFNAFVAMLAALTPDQCLIRGTVRSEAQQDVRDGCQVRRLAYDRGPDDPDGECPAAFESAARNWIVLDVDESSTPFDATNIEGSVAAWRATLPAELQGAQSAFFLSASSHLSPTVRGKLVVALDAPLDDCTAAVYAKANGFDGSVCHAVQPNYFAAPIFDGCSDPLEGKRAPIRFAGAPARLPATPIGLVAAERTLGARDITPTDIPDLSLRAFALADAIRDRWFAGGRIESHAWLHLCGWCLARGWTKGELGAMLAELDRDEPDTKKVREHWHVLGNARAIEGAGGAREWLGDAFAKADAAVSHNDTTEAFAARVADRAARTNAFASASETAAGARASIEADPLAMFGGVKSFLADDLPIGYLCEGLRLAPSDGKISLIAGNAGGGKGPIADHLAVCFALGLPAFGDPRFATVRSRVMLLDCEGSRLTLRRLKRMARAMGADPADLEGWIILVNTSGADLTSPEALDAITIAAERFDARVVIVDSYTSAMLASGIDSNSPEYAALARALGALDRLVIAVAHAVKASASKGEPTLADIAYSQALGAMGQTVLVVHYPDREDRDLVRIACARSPEERFEPFEVRFRGGKGEPLSVTIDARASAMRAPALIRMRDAIAAAGTAADKIEEFLREHPTCPQTSGKLRDAVGVRGLRWSAAKDECLRRGTIVEHALGSHLQYTLALADD
jgi:hypothetical protein